LQLLLYRFFFNLGSAKVASKKDLVNLQAIADMAKANNKVLIACGSADSKTGGSAYNQTLSEQRAETVKAELVKLGVPENMIEVKAVGGVDEIEPYTYNRRAVVSIK
jgi:outer membrane protein OmpA-like peptidoglycan-associated protein